MLLSSGKSLTSKNPTKGANGFVVFVEDNWSYETEIPNSCLNGSILNYDPCKRPRYDADAPAEPKAADAAGDDGHGETALGDAEKEDASGKNAEGKAAKLAKGGTAGATDTAPEPVGKKGKKDKKGKKNKKDISNLIIKPLVTCPAFAALVVKRLAALVDQRLAALVVQRLAAIVMKRFAAFVL